MDTYVERPGAVGWAGVRERVVAMVEARWRTRGQGPPGYPVFEPVLSEAEIAEAEGQFGVQLPEEYRSFLAEVGAGGPGPELSLSTLRRVDGKWVWEWDGCVDIPVDLSGPFVETADWVGRQRATLRAAGYEPTTCDDDTDHLEDYQRVFGEAGDEMWHIERDRGAVIISDNGCGMTSWLVLVGPHRGELRFRDCDINPPYEPLVDATGTPHTFRSWYLDWLERQERECR